MLCLFCAGINLALARSEILIRSVVSASTGRTFTDDTENPRIKITIPPGALSSDVRLSVRVRSFDKPLDDRQKDASPVYKSGSNQFCADTVSMTGNSIGGDIHGGGISPDLN